jgi:transposase
LQACGSAHHWARTLRKFGHTVRLIAPQLVTPCAKSNKNADAEAISEAQIKAFIAAANSAAS